MARNKREMSKQMNTRVTETNCLSIAMHSGQKDVLFGMDFNFKDNIFQFIYN